MYSTIPDLLNLVTVHRLYTIKAYVYFMMHHSIITE